MLHNEWKIAKNGVRFISILIFWTWTQGKSFKFYISYLDLKWIIPGYSRICTLNWKRIMWNVASIGINWKYHIKLFENPLGLHFSYITFSGLSQLNHNWLLLLERIVYFNVVPLLIKNKTDCFVISNRNKVFNNISLHLLPTSTFSCYLGIGNNCSCSTDLS